MFSGTSAVPPRRLARVIKDSSAARIAIVHEKDGSGNVCRKAMDIHDVEVCTKEPREVIAMDEELEKQVLHSLKVYRGSMLYVAVMVTIAVLILLLQAIF